jgi:hypothetical protein
MFFPQEGNDSTYKRKNSGEWIVYLDKEGLAPAPFYRSTQSYYISSTNTLGGARVAAQKQTTSKTYHPKLNSRTKFITEHSFAHTFSHPSRLKSIEIDTSAVQNLCVT